MNPRHPIRRICRALVPVVARSPPRGPARADLSRSSRCGSSRPTRRAAWATCCPARFATGLTDLLGQQVIVENRPGASMVIGTQAAARSPADGYTLVFGSVTSLAIKSAPARAALRPGEGLRAGYAVLHDAALPRRPPLPSRQIGQGTHRAAQARSRASSPFASGGNGSSNHLAGELFKSLARVDMLHVPYKSAGPAMTDVIAGHVSLMFGAAGSPRRRPARCACSRSPAPAARPPRHSYPPCTKQACRATNRRSGSACSRPPARPERSWRASPRTSTRCSPSRSCASASHGRHHAQHPRSLRRADPARDTEVAQGICGGEDPG